MVSLNFVRFTETDCTIFVDIAVLDVAGFYVQIMDIPCLAYPTIYDVGNKILKLVHLYIY